MKKSNIFIAASIAFLSFLVIYYGCRLVYYYKLAHTEEKLGETLFSEVFNSISYSKDIIKKDNNFYYQGNVLNNYLYYSNRYYRIIGNVDGHMVLVDDIATILPFNGEFEKNDIYNWLNVTDVVNSGIYYNSLYEPEKYLDLTKTCIDLECTNFVTSTVGIISKNQYNLGSKYLNNSSFYWLSDGSFVSYDNEIKENTNDVYGVRPVITLKDDVIYYGGSGTYYDPYFIDLNDALSFDNTEANSISIGSYIKYSDKVWRVMDNSDNYKLVLNESIGKHSFSSKNGTINIKDKTSILYYLNNEFYNSLNKKYLVKTNFNIGNYKTSYLDKYSSSISLNVGLQEFGDLFMSDVNDCLILSTINNSIYKVINGKLYADSYKNENNIRPVISISKNIKILDGYGTIDSPFELGDL